MDAVSITSYFSYQGVMFMMANPLAIVGHKRIVLSDLNTLVVVLLVEQLNEIIFLKIDIHNYNKKCNIC